MCRGRRVCIDGQDVFPYETNPSVLSSGGGGGSAASPSVPPSGSGSAASGDGKKN
jgi:hypothetical protein